MYKRQGQHTGGKGGAVAAAVVGVDQQTHIQQLCLLVGELLIRAVGAEAVSYTHLAVHQLAVGPEALAGLAVVADVLALVDIALLIQLGDCLLYTSRCV